jgi:hypothetical protein
MNKIVITSIFALLMIIPSVHALTDAGLDRVLMKLDDMEKAGLITTQENYNAIEWYHSKHFLTEQAFRNSEMRVLVYSQTGKYDPSFLMPVTHNIFNVTLMKCTVYVDGTSVDVLGTIKNRDTSAHAVIVTYSVLDSSGNILKSIDSDRHQIQGLNEWLVEQTISGVINADHCGLSVKILS